MAWREASDEGGGRRDRTTRDGLSKEEAVQQKDGRTKRWPRAEQDQGSPRPKGQHMQKEEGGRGQALKGSQCARSAPGQGTKGKQGSRQAEARVTGLWPIPDFKFQEKCSRRLLKGPRRGITGVCVYRLRQVILQQETKSEAVQAETNDVNGLDQ